MSYSDLDTLGKALANAAMTVLVRSCRAELAAASHERLDPGVGAGRHRRAEGI